MVLSYFDYSKDLTIENSSNEVLWRRSFLIVNNTITSNAFIKIVKTKEGRNSLLKEIVILDEEEEFREVKALNIKRKDDTIVKCEVKKWKSYLNVVCKEQCVALDDIIFIVIH